MVKNIPCYIKDTNDFHLKLLGVCIPPGNLLVKLDFTSLYTSIPHKEVQTHAGTHLTLEESLIPYKNIINLMKLVLKGNNFAFNTYIIYKTQNCNRDTNGPLLRKGTCYSGLRKNQQLGGDI